MFKSFKTMSVILLSTALLISCSPAAAPTPTAAPSATEEPTAQPTPSATLEPTPSGPFLDSESDFVFAPESANSWEAIMIFSAGALATEGDYYLYYTGIGRNWPESVGIGVASSSDGLNWERASDQPVLSAEGIDFAVQTILGSSALLQDDGTWVLYFYSIGTPDSDEQGASWIGRASADNPFGPFVADAEPVLVTGSEGAWDSFAVKNPHVIQGEDGYWMYYDGSDDNPEVSGFESIGLAFSEDGINWTKYDDPATSETAYAESDPIFRSSEDEDAWDGERVLEPNVIQTEDGWLMVYVSDQTSISGRKVFGIGYALSQDGIDWQRGSPDALLSSDEKGWHWLYTVSILEVEGTIQAYYSGRPSRSPITTNIYTLTQIGDLFP